MPQPRALTPDDLSILAELGALSARLGNEITRTQGAGGNTSVKVDGVMWVKASGTWLRDALDTDIFVPVALDPLRDALASGDIRADKATDFVIDSLNVSSLRPSIETSVHAVLPQRAVAHYHCVNTIAISVRQDAHAIVAKRLAALPELSWAIIPYRRPGLPLAQAIAQTVAQRPDILILRNHGIVVTAETIDELDRRIEVVSDAFSITPRSSKAPDIAYLQSLAEGTGYTLPLELSAHAFALDRQSCNAALKGTLYPDHVIFLGTHIGIVNDGEALDQAIAAWGNAPKLVVVPGRGVLVASELTAGGQAMVSCLNGVALRLSPDVPIEILTAEDEYALTNWEAEKYRQKLDKSVP